MTNSWRSNKAVAPVALLVVIALIVGITLWSSHSTPTRHVTGSATTENGPILYVTNLRSTAVDVVAFAGAPTITVGSGLGTQLPRLKAPRAPWDLKVVDRATKRALLTKRFDIDDPKQIELTAAGATIIDVLGQQDANDHGGVGATDKPLGTPPHPGPTLPSGTFATPITDHAFTSGAAGSAVDRRELASGVIPPNRPGCNDSTGKMVISDWGTLSYGPLGGSGSTDVVLPSPTGDLAYQLYGDPQIVRLNDGDLLYSRVVGLFTPISPKPSWFSYNNSYWRGGLAMWRSHCGNDWKLATLLDSNSIYDGKCAFPQGSDAGHWFGGFDRPQMYADPYSGTVFVSTYCTGGTAPVFPASQAFDNAFVLQWNPASGQWKAGADLSPHQAPNPLTSNQSALFEFRCEGWPTGPAKIYASGDGGNGFDSGRDLSGGDPAVTCQNNPRKLGDVIGYYTNAADFQMARTGPSSVRVVYPSVVDGRQVLRVDDVGYAPNITAVLPVHRPSITSAWDDGSIGHFTYIEEDGSFPGLADGDQHAALLAWQEYSPSKKQHRERALLFHGTTQIGSVFDLSSTWQMDNVGYWTGDYEYGGFGFWSGACHFAVPWNATETKTTGGLYIHDAVVDDPTCVAPLSATTTTTASTSTTTTTTLAPTSTTAAAFGVASISLTIDTCTNTGTTTNPWVCPVHAHFTLKPGKAGILHWQVKPSVVWYDACGGNADYSSPAQPQPDKAITANQSSVDIDGSIVFSNSREPVSATGNPTPSTTSMAHAISANVQSPDVAFLSDGNCKP